MKRSALRAAANRSLRSWSKATILLIATLPLAGCLAASAAGAVVGAGGAVAGAAVKGTGVVVGAAIPDGDHRR